VRWVRWVKGRDRERIPAGLSVGRGMGFEV